MMVRPARELYLCPEGERTMCAIMAVGSVTPSKRGSNCLEDADGC